MSKKGTSWSSDGSEIDIIETHSKVKHWLLEEYIEKLISTIYSSRRGGTVKFTLIDGFCGGGIYLDKHENNQLWYGSPIRFIQAVRKAHERSGRKHTLDVKYIFIDKNNKHLKCLKNFSMKQAGLEHLIDGELHISMNQKGGELIEQCQFICSEFEKIVNSCIVTADSRGGHTLFFLDPYGWSDVSMASFRKINSIKNSEIIFNFMIDYIYRFVIGANDYKTFDKILEAEGFFNEIRNPESVHKLDTFEIQSYIRNELMSLLRAKGKANKLFTFAVCSKESHDRVLYYLFHMSNHPRALEVMKDGCWTQNNLDCQYHYEIYGYGFKSVHYYQENQLSLEFNITIDNEEFCIEKLHDDLKDIIFNSEDGMLVGDFRRKTIEQNPAIKSHYSKYIRRLRYDKSIEVLRRNKNGVIQPTMAQNIHDKDIIKPILTYKQLRLFE